MDGRDLEKRVRLGRLLDFYGALLTEHRQEIARLYCEEDLSLQEIAQYRTEQGSPVTRQGVYDSLNKAEQQLTEYEEKLGLLSRWDRTARLASEGLKALETGDLEEAHMAFQNIMDL